MKPEDLRIGQWVSVSFTGQVVGIEPTKVKIRQSGLGYSEVPVESVELLAPSETLGQE